MANDKTSIVYGDWIDLLEGVTDNDAGIMFKNILRITNNQLILDEVSPDAKGIWLFIQKKMDEASKKYNEICQKNATNGKRGGNPNFKKGQGNPYYTPAPKDTDPYCPVIVGQIMITDDFFINYDEEPFSAYKNCDAKLKNDINRWLINTKRGEVVDITWICRQIVKFSINRGELKKLMGN